MAITAWAAKFVIRAICLSVKGRTSWRNGNRTDQFVFLQHWGGRERPHASKFDGRDGFPILMFACSAAIGDVNYRFRRDHGEPTTVFGPGRRSGERPRASANTGGVCACCVKVQASRPNGRYSRNWPRRWNSVL